jgi:Flp pilus assembly protein TadD
VSKQNWQSGLKKAEDYLSEEPKDIDFAIAVSAAMEQGGQAKTAVDLLRPIAATQTSYRLYTRYAWLLRQTGDIEGSLDMLRAAAQLDPKKMDAFYQLGYTLKALQRYEQATVAFEKLLEVQPNYPNIKEMLEEMRLQMATLKTKT